MFPNTVAHVVAGIRPVAFDQGAAERLVAALQALHDEVVAVARADGEASNIARAEWRGFTRRWFDERHAALHLDLRRLAVDASDLAQEVRRAQQVARRLQADRDDQLHAALARLAAAEEVGS